MRTRWGLGRPCRVAAAAAVALALLGAGCASTGTPLAQSGPGEAWGKCDPSPGAAFTLICFKR